ncbi:protein E17A [Elephant endotheliotropic herpesvirus 1A]|uniref:Protein E16B n=1 Tax=Elephant endotheliotropic herpesvirus 1A TaxID=759753 RepID=A0AA97AT79_ELHV1|nr:protein E17A [Elephant endotheliotropic herpesvirus 1A]WNZ34494.1 protein E16B [Elephant endotheliotropic herpesvirus 1A]
MPGGGYLLVRVGLCKKSQSLTFVQFLKNKETDRHKRTDVSHIHVKVVYTAFVRFLTCFVFSEARLIM